MVVNYVRDAAHQERADKIDIRGILLLAITSARCSGCSSAATLRLVRVALRDHARRGRARVGHCAHLARAHPRRAGHRLSSVLKSRQLATGVMFAAALGLSLYGGVFVLPIFLQSLHGFTAWQTGKVILPGALASAFTMAIVGRNAQKLDARYTIVDGAALFMVSMWQMSRITLDSGTGTSSGRSYSVASDSASFSCR